MAVCIGMTAWVLGWVGVWCGVVWLLVLQLHTSLPVCFSIINRRLLTELKHALSVENVFIFLNKGRNN